MSFLAGFIAIEIDEEGNTDVMRINYARHSEMLYSMDSEAVEDINIIQNGRELTFDAQAVGGKTLLKNNKV